MTHRGCWDGWADGRLETYDKITIQIVNLSVFHSSTKMLGVLVHRPLRTAEHRRFVHIIPDEEIRRGFLRNKKKRKDRKQKKGKWKKRMETGGNERKEENMQEQKERT